MIPNLDLTTCTARDVITAAILDFGAEALAGKLDAQANIHRDYMATHHNSAGYSGARAQMLACDDAAGALRDGDIKRLCQRDGSIIVAFNAACKMLHIPAATRTAIAVRSL